MSTSTLLLILWSALCLGLSLSVVSHRGRTTGEVLGETASSLGIGMVLWSIGVGLWMMAGFVVRAI